MKRHGENDFKAFKANFIAKTKAFEILFTNRRAVNYF